MSKLRGADISNPASAASLGPWGIEEYLETKQVYINLNEAPIGWY